MRRFLCSVLLVGACGPRAGDSCPPVPSVGQPCDTEGVVCYYQQPSACASVPKYTCKNKRWTQQFTTIAPGCDASTPSDAAADAPKDAPSDVMNSSDG